MHGHSSERPGMEDNAERQSSPAQAEKRTGWIPRSAARHHQMLTFKGSAAAVGAVAGLGCRLGSSYQKAPRSEPNFAKLTVCTPTKSTICYRSGYLDRARDLGTESCIAVHSKSLNSARRWMEDAA